MTQTINIDVSQVLRVAARNAIGKAVESIIEEKMTDLYVEIVGPPPDGTPVDSGALRNSYHIDTSDPKKITITSNSPYAAEINKHSKQSHPAYIQLAIDRVFR